MALWYRFAYKPSNCEAAIPIGRIRARDREPRRVMPLIVTWLVRLFRVWGTWSVPAAALGRGWATEREIAAASMISGARFPRIPRRYIRCF